MTRLRPLAGLLLLLAGCDGWTADAPPPPPRPLPEGARLQGTTTLAAALAPPGPPDDAALRARGAERYAIYCTPCHGAAGAGDGPVVARGFPRPPDIRAAPAPRSMAAVAENRGTAHPFADRLPPRDRWAVARFVEALPR